MNHQNFGSAVIPAMAGFFLFGKRAKVQEIQAEKYQLPAVVENPAGGTGVSRYLMTVPVVSGVAKYLNKKDKDPVTGVSVYVLRQTIAERNAPAVTSVAKYLTKVAKELPHAKSTVDKYLVKQDFAAKKVSSLTGVARYEAEQNLLERKKAAVALTQKYRDEEAAAMLAKQKAAAKELKITKKQIKDAEAAIIAQKKEASTGVGRYLQQTGMKPDKQSTGVSRYISKKIIADSQKPALSKVSRYIGGQSASSKKTFLTGVARYLSKQPVATKPSPAKEKLLPSGVSRYLATQTEVEQHKPAVTGVAKYLDNAAKQESSKIKKLENLSKLAAEAVGKSVEGEFIPANSFYANTGVSRYLERQGLTAVTAVNTFAGGKATGVDRYLLSKAS